VLISTVGVSVVWVGTMATIGALNAWDRLKQRRIERQARKAKEAEEQRLRKLELDETQKQRAAEEKERLRQTMVAEKQRRLKMLPQAKIRITRNRAAHEQVTIVCLPIGRNSSAFHRRQPDLIDQLAM
jgi:hypothetical protein